MKKLIVVCLILEIFWGIGVCYAGTESKDNNATSSYIGQEKISKLIEEINGPDPLIRSEAANEIMALYYHKGIKIKEAVPGLIRELEAIDFEHLTEGTGEHSANLILVLGEYKDDRAIPAMMNSLGHAGGKLVIEAFAKMGPVIVEPLIQKLQDSKKRVRSYAATYLGRVPVQMEKNGQQLAASDRMKVKNALATALQDKNEDVRKVALGSIGVVQSIYSYDEIKDLIPAVASVALHDPYARKSKSGAEVSYPVRSEAARVLKQLEAKRDEKMSQ